MKRSFSLAASLGLIMMLMVVQAGCSRSHVTSGRAPTRWQGEAVLPRGSESPSSEECDEARSRGYADGYAAAIEYLAGHPDPPLVVAVDVPSECGGFDLMECKVEYADAYHAGFQKGLDRVAIPRNPDRPLTVRRYFP